MDRATSKQIWFLGKLVKERDYIEGGLMDDLIIKSFLSGITSFSKRQASLTIDMLLNCPLKAA